MKSLTVVPVTRATSQQPTTLGTRVQRGVGGASGSAGSVRPPVPGPPVISHPGPPGADPAERRRGRGGGGGAHGAVRRGTGARKPLAGGRARVWAAGRGKEGADGGTR